ncbi:rhodanese-like domain-containing protein [Comamonas sp. C11]|uniref:rhodanese-like domain-containing protein n=1 Tax=Comamonas sp. C11 TaxID=2966554 RepID=UPI002113497E|nr:rhodanese-like domain-containing protein [Comamonas sp. C11]UUC94457.1 rhodanese-like domain-containing protein [Comamonas sp. C11]
MKTAHEIVAEAKAYVTEVPLDQAQDAIRAADILIDVREVDEYVSGHLEGAVCIPRGVLEFRLTGNSAFERRDLAVVLYCRTSGRAALAARSMQSMGYLNVKSIAGGIEAWLKAGLPVVQPEQPSFD